MYAYSYAENLHLYCLLYNWSLGIEPNPPPPSLTFKTCPVGKTNTNISFKLWFIWLHKSYLTYGHFKKLNLLWSIFSNIISNNIY